MELSEISIFLKNRSKLDQLSSQRWKRIPRRDSIEMGKFIQN
jgi:hypothetical protein